MHEKNIFLDKPMITSSHFNWLYHSLRQSFGNISSACKLQYLHKQSDIVFQKQEFLSVLP